MRTSLLAAAFLLGLLVGIGMSGKAQDYLVLSGLVYHLDGEQHCNNRFTRGIGYEHQLSKKTRLAVGYYDNSNCDDSFYVAGAWLPLRVSDWKLGVMGGVVSGYSNAILPAGGLIFAYEPEKKVGFNIIFIPPAGDTSKGVCWLQAKLPW